MQIGGSVTVTGGIVTDCVAHVCSTLGRDATPEMYDMIESICMYVFGGIPTGVFHPDEIYSDSDQCETMWETAVYLRRYIDERTPGSEQEAKEVVMKRLTNVFRAGSRV